MVFLNCYCADSNLLSVVVKQLSNQFGYTEDDLKVIPEEGLNVFESIHGLTFVV